MVRVCALAGRRLPATPLAARQIQLFGALARVIAAAGRLDERVDDGLIDFTAAIG